MEPLSPQLKENASVQTEMSGAVSERRHVEEESMITLLLRYTIDPNKLADIKAYAEAELRPIRESGGNIIGYYLPTDFAGATNEAFGVIEFASLADYEVYRAKLAAHPLHKQ
jgi:hypothetical protein